MDKEAWRRFLGLKRLIHDGVESIADLVEKHHRLTAEKPFHVLESIPPIAAPTRLVRGVHDGVLSLTYGSIRAINQATEAASDRVISWLAPADDAGRGNRRDHHQGPTPHRLRPFSAGRLRAWLPRFFPSPPA